VSEPFIGQIQAFAFGWAPKGWLPCNGQLLDINEYRYLFSLIGTLYGGDGIRTFAVPDLRGRVPINQGQGPGLSNHDLTHAGGSENVTLTQTQMPLHTHDASGYR
jgi:microcystin-dependent protein